MGLFGYFFIVPISVLPCSLVLNSVEEIDSSSPEMSDEEDTDDAYEVPLTKSRKKSDHITLHIPRKSLLKGTAELASRCNVSNRVATAVLAKVVKMGGGQLDDCTISKSSSHRHRASEVKESAMKIKQDFAENLPKFLVLHWDSKIIKYEKRRECDDRLAVVASLPERNTNQFLGAPMINDATGTTMKETLMDVLQEWQIPDDIIIGMSWDTTASNTGIHSGSAMLMEQELGHAILWLACRHHIGELHVKHANIQCRGARKGKSQ